MRYKSGTIYADSGTIYTFLMCRDTFLNNFDRILYIRARILMRKLNPGQYKLQSWTILALNHVIRESWTFYVAIPAQFKLDKACSSSIFSG